MKKAVCLVLVFAMASLLFCGCSPKTYSKTLIYFDTVVKLSSDSEEVLQKSEELCIKYDNLFSKTNEQSDIYKINSCGKATVDNATVEIIRAALEYSRITEDAFSIKLGALSELWNFTSLNPKKPDDKKIEKALRLAKKGEIKVEDNKVSVPQGVKIDLGGIAKGYIAEKIAEIYRENNATGIIDLGGNILAVGEKKTKENYKIGIKNPLKTQETFAIVEIPEGSVVTSGNYERGFTLDGERYHHILDLKTGRPVKNGLSSVTVISKNSTDGDALSTALFCMGEEKGREFLEKLSGIEAVFIDEKGECSFTSGLEVVDGNFVLKE